MRSKLRAFLELVKFEHTAFALPFAYLGMLVPGRQWPPAGRFLLVTAAMVGARTAGMTLNRLVDLEIDARNPRTKNRPSVTGEIPPRTAWIAAGVSIAVLVASAAALNPLCLKLSPVALALLFGYHYAKRFTWLCHFTLGFVLAMAPVGGWIAVTGRFDWQPLVLAAAVLFWVAGFDILYALQDVDFDRDNRLHSVPVRFGVGAALKISSACHAATAVFLALFAAAADLGVVYLAGVAVTAGLLYVEHRLVSEDDLSRLNAAFFSINGWIGVLLLVFTWIEVYR